MKIGLALSSGGARGFSHIGVIKVLLKNKIKIDYVAGTSMGSLVGAYFALHGNVIGLEKEVLTLTRTKVLKLVDVNNPKRSLVKGEKTMDYIRQFLGDMTFADTKIPLLIGATSLETGKEVVIKEGKLVDAIRMSGAFPGVFAPVKYQGMHLVDGGLSNATPVNLVKRMGAKKVIASDLFSLESVDNKDFSMLESLLRTYDILMCNLSKYNKYDENIVVLKPQAGRRVETFNFFNAERYIKAGETEAMKNIKKIKELVK